LGLGYLWFTIIISSSAFFSILFLPMWGKFAARYGNREVLKITGFMTALIPIFWTLSPNPIYLIFVPQLVAGFAISGFNLSSSNFIYDAVTVQKRAIIVAYYGMFNGIAIFLGAGVGGIFAQYVEIPLVNTLFLLFIISGILRFLFSFFMIPKIKEVKNYDTFTKRNPLLYLKEIKPTYGPPLGRMSPISSVKLFSKKIKRLKANSLKSKKLKVDKKIKK